MDTYTRIASRVRDFIAMSVPEVWIINPATRSASVARGNATQEHPDDLLKLPGTPLEISLKEIFKALDED